MRRRGVGRGQSLSEYVVLLSVVAAAVVGMQLYVKRGVQAKLRTGVDHWLAVSTMRDGNIPKECADQGIFDPADCAQFFGSQIDDVAELEAMGITTFATTQSEGMQQKVYTYASNGAQVTITRNKDGTSVNRKIDDGLFITRGLPPPEFVRRPRLPSGLPSGSSIPSSSGPGGSGGGGGTFPGDPDPGTTPGTAPGTAPSGPPAPGQQP